jgi:DNA-binding MarR family transcriptional regulator
LARRSTDGPLSVLELDAWRGLLRTHARLVRELDRQMSQSEGIGLTAYDVMLKLAQAPGRRLRMKQIAEAMLLSRSGLTGIISDLEGRGYVVRETVSDDRRGIEAVLTRTGNAALRRAHRMHLAGVRAGFLRHLSEEQLQHLAQAWSAVGTPTGPDQIPTDAVSG